MYPPAFYILALAIIGLMVAVPQLIASLKRWHTTNVRK
jgi:uncharacterized membrane protein YhaH (DUF805 family)